MAPIHLSDSGFSIFHARGATRHPHHIDPYPFLAIKPFWRRRQGMFGVLRRLCHATDSPTPPWHRHEGNRYCRSWLYRLARRLSDSSWRSPVATSSHTSTAILRTNTPSFFLSSRTLGPAISCFARNSTDRDRCPPGRPPCSVRNRNGRGMGGRHGVPHPNGLYYSRSSSSVPGGSVA